MSKYRLLSDAILDGSKLRPQGKGLYVDSRGQTCALGAAIHAVTGEPSDCVSRLWKVFNPILEESVPCPVEGCGYGPNADYTHSLETIIPHLNDDHEWSREQIAGFVATVEERLGLVEIISDESEYVQHSITSVTEGAPFSVVGESVVVSS